ncbi:MAG TPA: enoyl-CoA hydratase [Flavobacteriales bacterium]|nr:enoyl-CoA hydratase [Flavobacteriales bacterium]|tara:strand:+ start:4754 stop:5524 length:771 start_codon:yes stop_codon:yes gene_type:complete
MSLVLKSLEDGILTLTIHRPEALNALNGNVIDALSAALEAAQENREVRVIVLTGAGDKAFVAGADIKEFADYDQAQGEELARRGQRDLFDRVEQSRKPIVAAVNGFALGGGLELAMAAHVRIASSNARMGLPEVSLGVIPGYGGTQRLAQIVGKGKAMEMVLTGGMIDAESALACGLVNQVVDQELLLETAHVMAGKIAKNAPTALSAALDSVLAGYSRDGFGVEIARFGECFATQDFKEGTTAFLEKRKPQFPGS